jgi:DNA-binding response OmpR family regulator
MRVLLVEDDDMIGDSVRKGLRHDGFAIDWVRDGEAAIHAVTAPGAAMGAAGAEPGATLFDLMLLDIRMPGKDGVEVRSHVLPGAGTGQPLDLNDNPVVGAAKARAAAAKEA